MTGVSTGARTTASTPDEPVRTGVRSRNRRGEGGLLRPQILTAAAELLDEGGTEEAITLRAVARRAGIAAPSIYAHFVDRQAILMAIVTDAFAELKQQMTEAGTAPDAIVRLYAVSTAYLDFAATRPKRYRVMFGGLWSAAQAVDESAITAAEAVALGQDVLAALAACVQACVDAGHSTSSDARDDAIALWLGLHGLAHQRTVARVFPWPSDIAERIINSLAHLTTSACP